MNSNIVELFRDYVINRMDCYKMTKANLPVRAELANACEHLKELIENNGWKSVDDELPKQFEKVLLSGQNAMNDFGLFASETEIIECPYCQYEFSLDDIECIDEKIQAENMIENERKGTLLCTNHDCKKPFYFEGFVEYRYASKKLESKK